MMPLELEPIKNFLDQLQKKIVLHFSQIDGANFKEDSWSRAEGGGGLSCVLEGGRVFERAGVNVSHVMGKGLPPSATANRPELAGADFEAMGLSLVVHPRNPMVPTSHMNIRVFMAKPKNKEIVWWFGGGFDLTPYYLFEEDAVFWHQEARRSLEPFGKLLYPQFKKWADNYFYLPHRQEARGIGGIFFDDFNALGFEESFSLMKSVGEGYLKAYEPIVRQRKDLPYTDAERAFQCYRRGRYVEFNLVYDRGTIFGLQSRGRTESILMSMPPEVTWRYAWEPEPLSREAELYTALKTPRDWLAC